MSLRILVVMLFIAMAVGAASRSPAQVATPSAESLFADLGLPEITLTATDEGLEISPRKVPAGRYLVTLDNQSGDPDLPVVILRLDRDDPFVCDGVGVPPQCFSSYHRIHIPGGVSGHMPQAVLNFPAGRYGLWGTGELGEYPAAILRVSGDPNAAIDGPEPEAAAIIVTKEADGYGFALHVEGELRPGVQLVKVVNTANQPIFIAAAQDPAPFIGDLVAGTPVFSARGASIPFDVHDEEQFGRITTTAPQSVNATQWVAMDLTSGPVYLAAYIPDPTTLHEWSSWFAATAVIVPVTAS